MKKMKSRCKCCVDIVYTIYQFEYILDLSCNLDRALLGHCKVDNWTFLGLKGKKRGEVGEGAWLIGRGRDQLLL